MTVKTEVETRQEADGVEVSNDYGSGLAEGRLSRMDRYSSNLKKPHVQNAKTMALPQFSVKQVYFTVGVYGILLSSALWASVNILQWVWHKLL